MSALLPVITAIVSDRAERGYLAMVAHTNEVVDLPLETAPIDSSPHALEIRVEGEIDAPPLVVMADPIGAPTKKGFPLRLRPLDAEQQAYLERQLLGGSREALDPTLPALPRGVTLKAPTLREVKRSGVNQPVSADHAAALTRTTNASSRSRAPGSLTGRVFGDRRFTLEDLLGGGASGEVYRALHTALRRRVAVKVLHPSLQYDPDYCTRFYSEALAASRLDHVNVLRVLDYGQEPDGLLYIAMELLVGKDLQRILDEEGPLSTARIVTLITQACAGLAHAHDAGLVHRDIKPENIVVVTRRDDDGEEMPHVKVCDFGIAHWDAPTPDEIGDDDRTLVKRPDDSKVVGTPLYMAPEQIRNEPVDARTDVYALGVVLYELATGRAPFSAERAIDVLHMHLRDKPVPPSSVARNVDPGLERIIMRALEKDAKDRQPNARALRSELRSLTESQPAFAPHKKSSGEIPVRAPHAADVANTPIAKVAHENPRVVQVQKIGESLRAAIVAADAAGARELVVWLQTRLSHPASSEPELEASEHALRALRDPASIAGLVQGSLKARSGDQTRRDEDIYFMLRAAGPVAMRALIDARRRLPPIAEIRARFVELARAIGAPSLPVLIETLTALIAFTTPPEEAFVEDLFACIPDVLSDVGGEIAVRFVRADKPKIAGLALRATTMLWGPRAQSLLLGVLDAPAPPLQLVAIEMLEARGRIDDWAIERLVRIVSSTTLPEDLRRRAASALSLASPESRQNATAFLQYRLGLGQNLVVPTPNGPRGGEPAGVVLSLARSFAALDPAGARPVLQRLAAVRTDLREALTPLLGARPNA